MAQALTLKTKISHGEEVVADLHERVDTIVTRKNQEVSFDQATTAGQTIQQVGHI